MMAHMIAAAAAVEAREKETRDEGTKRAEQRESEWSEGIGGEAEES